MSTSLFATLVTAYDAHRRYSRRAFQQFNLSDGYPKVLMNLHHFPGSLQKEVAFACRVEPATMTVLLRGMQAKGLIRKEETHVSGGKRALRIFLTEEGEKMAQECAVIVDETTDKALQDFSDEEKELLIHFLNRITQHLSED